jgi:multiple sugar transport system substrate-binding protein
MTRDPAPSRATSAPIVLGAILALLVGACGGATTTTAPSAAAPSVAASAEPSTASAAPSDAGYTGPEATITYSIWGDPSEIKSQQAVVDAFHAMNPKITVKVTVSDWDTYWDKLQTGIAGGDAPDVFAMDGPLFPDYQSRGVLLDLKPYIDKSGYDLGQLADQAVGDFTTETGQFGLPRDLNVIALFYNKAMFDAAKVAYPDDTWDWAKLVTAAHSLTKDTNGDGKPDQWGFYTETSDMENYWSSLVWQNGGEIISPDKKSTVLGTDQAVGGLQFLQDLIWKE